MSARLITNAKDKDKDSEESVNKTAVDKNKMGSQLKKRTSAILHHCGQGLVRFRQKKLQGMFMKYNHDLSDLISCV